MADAEFFAPPKSTTKEILHKIFKDAEWATTAIFGPTEDEKIRLRYIRVRGKMYVYASLPEVYPTYTLINVIVVKPDMTMEDITTKVIPHYQKRFMPTRTIPDRDSVKIPLEATKYELATTFANCERVNSHDKMYQFFRIANELFVYMKIAENYKQYTLQEVLMCNPNDELAAVINDVIIPYITQK